MSTHSICFHGGIRKYKHFSCFFFCFFFVVVFFLFLFFFVVVVFLFFYNLPVKTESVKKYVSKNRTFLSSVTKGKTDR